MASSITSATSVFGYLIPEGFESRTVNLYSQFIEADPSATVVPLKARPECLESAVHNVRTGLVPGMCVDSSLYMGLGSLMDAITKEASVSNVIDTVFADCKTGALVGDCTGVSAFRNMSSFLGTVDEPVVAICGGGWETRVAMTALSGEVTMIQVQAEPDALLDDIPTGCVVEYVPEFPSFEPFDLVVNPPDGFNPRENQYVIRTSAWFECLRLALSVGKFRGLPENISLDTAEQYKKIIAHV